MLLMNVVPPILTLIFYYWISGMVFANQFLLSYFKYITCVIPYVTQVVCDALKLVCNVISL